MHRRQVGPAQSAPALPRPPLLDSVAPFVRTGSLNRLVHSESPAILALCAGVLGAGVSSILRASQHPLWYDEIYTVVLSRLDPASSMWSALQDAVDTNPPLYYLVTRL